jgi:Protein of unknown function (DUF4013)
VNSVGDAFGFPFRDPAWAGKIAVQALILIIPIVGLIATAGWMLMTFDNLRAGRQELAPAGFHLSRGIGLFGVWFIYSFVLSLPGGILNGMGSGLSTNHSYSADGFSGLGSLLSLAGQLFFYFLLPSIIVMTYHHGFAGGMDVEGVWRLATGNVSTSVVSGLVMFVAALIGLFGIVACCIGIFFTGAYAAAVMTWVASWFERQRALPATPPPAV